MATRWAIPPERSRGQAVLEPVQAHQFDHLARACASAPGDPADSSGRVMFSSTVRQGIRLAC